MLRMSLVRGKPLKIPMWIQHLMVLVSDGGSGGKGALPPAPPRATQQKYLYGRGAPRGPRWPMKQVAGYAGPSCWMWPLPLGDRVSGLAGPKARRVLKKCQLKAGRIPVCASAHTLMRGVTTLLPEYEEWLLRSHSEWRAGRGVGLRILWKGACARPSCLAMLKVQPIIPDEQPCFDLRQISRLLWSRYPLGQKALLFKAPSLLFPWRAVCVEFISSSPLNN